MRLLLLICLLLTLPVPSQANDSPEGTLIVANMLGRSVWFIDAKTGEKRAEFATRYDPHEVAVSSDGRLAAVTNYGGSDGAGNIIQIADVAEGKVVRELEIADYERLHGVAFLPGDSLLVATSERTGDILVFSAMDGSMRRAVSTGGRAPHMLSPGGRWIYAANILDGTVARVDPFGEEETNTWPVNANRTEGVAATPDGSQGWTGSMESGVVVGVDGETGKEVARIEGLQVPYRLMSTPDGATIVVSDPAAGLLAVIDRAAGMLTEMININTAAQEVGLGADASPQGFIVSPDSRWAWVSAKSINRVVEVDLVEQEVVRFMETGAGPDGIAFSAVR